MWRERKVQIAASAVLAGCLLTSTLLTTAIAASIGKNRLVYADRAEDGDPPEVAIGIAMASFRSLFVNILWIQANERKQEGRYYDAVELARAITKLQPRFPRVWAFHAWNLAYNISVATDTPEERWNWVSQGIRLLRDEGIPKNPNDMVLHRELAWIFQHKVQGYMDDANQFYKRRHAFEWTIVLGPPPGRRGPGVTPEQRTADIVAWLTRIQNAPDTLRDAIDLERADAARDRFDPKAPELIARLKSEAGIDLSQRLYNDQGTGPAEQLLYFIEMVRSTERVRQELKLGPDASSVNPSAFQLLGEPQYRRAWQILAVWARKRLIIDKYHMEPDRMVRYTQEYGPLDWRHAAAHSVYWSVRGVENQLLRVTDDNRNNQDFLNTDRLTVQSVQELFRSGDVYFDIANPTFYVAMPSADFIPIYGKKLKEVMDRGGIFEDPRKRLYTPYAAGYENFLKDAVRYLYRRGDKAEAAKWFAAVRDFNLANLNDPERAQSYAKPLDQWVIDEITEDDRFAVPNVALGEVSGALQSAFFQGLLAGNTKVFDSQIDFARKFHTLYTERQVFNVGSNPDIEARMELMDRDFNTFAGNVLATMVTVAGLPDGAIMYQRAPEWLRLRAYIPIENNMPAAAANRVEFETLFPPPTGLDAYRAHLAREAAQRRGDIVENK